MKCKYDDPAHYVEILFKGFRQFEIHKIDRQLFGKLPFANLFDSRIVQAAENIWNVTDRIVIKDRYGETGREISEPEMTWFHTQKKYVDKLI
jgi:hypothetical protein